MRISRALFVALLLALSAAPARAGEVTISFDFSASTIEILGGIITIPPGGSITAASGDAVFLATSPTQISAGPARLENLDLAATIDQDILGQALITGDILAQQLPGAPYGALSAGLGNAVFFNVLLDTNVSANCVGAGCPFIGTFPILISGNFTAGNLNVVLGNIETLSAATAMGDIPLSLSGFSGVLHLVGSEVSRSFNPVPEPGTLGTFAFGIGVLALAARLRAGRRALQGR
jgi:hypothetical protein